ncbi:putative ABC transport system permease protein [Paenibacillus sp. DS2363]|uniref:FtsX-like permease family protein n=1 Tax=Paenibacillus TaxID=44249 RepID=UPI001C8D1E28|nr:FtsX-like permease family protein [Paenibacillus xylanexedens]MBY0115762.1 ABC transporter permease [Paenibacillus xylanexedens]MCP1423739.1 putative ABC transport system permease protein [Paenibacillus xylanexedens]
MTFQQFAFNNVMRNKRLYIAYFLSSAFAVMVFFVYGVFAFHPGLATREIGSPVTIGLLVAQMLIYLFSFFFVLYSMSAFIKSRSREFGLLVMFGITNMQLRRLVFIENIVIGFGATLTGVASGLVLSKILLLAAESLIGMEEELPFYMPYRALVLTFAAFMLLFLGISLFTVLFFRGNKLIDLLKGSTKPRPEPRASIWLSLASLALIGCGYGVSLVVEGLMVVYALLPVTVAVVVGTYFLFTQLSVYTIRGLKHNRRLYWRRTNLLFFNDLAYRMKDNARTFFLVTILSTVAFSAIGALVGFKTILTESIEKPFAFEYISYAGNSPEQAASAVDVIEHKLFVEGIPFTKLQAELRSYKRAESNETVMIVSESMYNTFAVVAGDQKLKLGANEAAIVQYNSIDGRGESFDEQELAVEGGGKPLLITQSASFLMSEYMSKYNKYYVMNDDRYEQLPEPQSSEGYYVFAVSDWKATEAVGQQLNNEIGHSKNDSFFSLAFHIKQLLQSYSAVMFVGLFVGVVFFVASGSFLYFRLYTDLDDDKAKYASIMKLGLTSRELSKIVTRQMAILFFLPIAIALIHGAVALTALQGMFNFSLIKESIIVLSAFAIIQIVYFLVIRSGYLRQLRSGGTG